MPNGHVLVIAEALAAGRTSVPGGEMWPTMIAKKAELGVSVRFGTSNMTFIKY
jgi:hypothetical protein